ncbi:STAS domain-containing protein [Streptomyces sp. NPDC021969]|uniref:STAS domain-containing protein n=1 Tax=unclassified Streptomyces TaxID=2593676 RepID=UPI0033C8662C
MDVASVELAASGSCVVARVGGEMDYQSDPWLRSRFDQLITEGGRFVVDLSGVSFCDSAGLNVLLGARRQAEMRGAVLALACVPAHLRRILEMTGADQVLRVFATVTDAEAALDG